MSKYVYGIDIGGTTVKFGLFDQFGTLLKKWEIKSLLGNNGTDLINAIYQSIIKNTPNLSEVIGYGFGVPGPVVNNHIPVVVNLGWEHMNLKEEYQGLLNNTNIFTGNDANVAALGEAAFGAGKGKKNVALMTLGTGVGGGIVVDGKLVEGYHGAAGEIGHLNVFPKYVTKCNCGNEGCLETVASATGIRNLYYAMRKEYKGESSLFKLEYPSAKAIFDAAKNKDELALTVIDAASDYIGYACSVLSVMTNPEIIVLGGGVSKAGSYLIDKVSTAFDRYCFKPVKETKIVQAVLGNDAGIYGAAGLVINHG